ncbi:hypothetical protein PVAND_004968 [Polypedilum vanderplanki]|uniref:Glycine rich protein n=1 Tax=Polypedilum vanderplanki TaxID=319348 RepID=A0A9J6BZM4_POLVA|nr:hypothetical protein PVAND_004968 [Polypedilum vanderplanki]
MKILILFVFCVIVTLAKPVEEVVNNKEVDTSLLALEDLELKTPVTEDDSSLNREKRWHRRGWGGGFHRGYGWGRGYYGGGWGHYGGWGRRWGGYGWGR